MKRGLAIIVFALAVSAAAQEVDVRSHARTSITLQTGFEVPLRLLDELSTKRTPKGTIFRMEVSEDVTVDGVIAIPAGTQAIGEVTRSDAKGAFGKSGKLEARVMYLTLDNKPVQMSGILTARGEGGTTETVAAAVLAGTLAFAVTGKSAVLPKGALLIGLLNRPLTVHPVG